MDGDFKQGQFGNIPPQTPTPPPQIPQQQQPPLSSVPPSMEQEPPKKRGGKWWIWLVVVFVLIVGGLLGVFAYIKGTPQYSLYQMWRATQNKDYEEFIKYFNVDAVIDDIFNKAVEDVKKQYGGMYSEEELVQIEMLAKTQVEAAKKQAKEEIKKQIEEGKFSLTEDYEIRLLDVFREVKVKKLSRTEANVTMTNKKGQSVTFTMRKKDGYWEIYKIDMTLEEIQKLIENK